MATALDTSMYENKIVGELNGVRLYRRSDGPEPGFTLQVDGKVRKFVRATRAWKAELAAITREAEALAGGALDGLGDDEQFVLGWCFGLIDGRPRTLGEIATLLAACGTPLSHKDVYTIQRAVLAKLRRPEIAATIVALL